MKHSTSLFVPSLVFTLAFTFTHAFIPQLSPSRSSHVTLTLQGWVEQNGEWTWKEDVNDNNLPSPTVAATNTVITATATPQLPSGTYKPKQSLGQNYLRDGNTVAKIVAAFDRDATRRNEVLEHIVELGPGAGAITDRLIDIYGVDKLQVIEIDPRSVEILQERHPQLNVIHSDVLQIDYPQLAEEAGQPLSVIGNLPYYITSQILFALADASHFGAVDSATVTMQWEVGQRMVASTSTKDYGILSVVFQLYAEVNNHFKIPPTVFYPKPKVDSCLLGLHFVGPKVLRQRLAGVAPAHLRRVVTTAFQQRRKTLRNSLRKLAKELGRDDALQDTTAPPLPASISSTDAVGRHQALPPDWPSLRPEQLTPGQFIEVTRCLFGESDPDADLGRKVWRKLKHGSNGESMS